MSKRGVRHCLIVTNECIEFDHYIRQPHFLLYLVVCITTMHVWSCIIMESSLHVIIWVMNELSCTHKKHTQTCIRIVLCSYIYMCIQERERESDCSYKHTHTVSQTQTQIDRQTHTHSLVCGPPWSNRHSCGEAKTPTTQVPSGCLLLWT